jgi:hypothetical protein
LERLEEDTVATAESELLSTYPKDPFTIPVCLPEAASPLIRSVHTSFPIVLVLLLFMALGMNRLRVRNPNADLPEAKPGEEQAFEEPQLFVLD